MLTSEEICCPRMKIEIDQFNTKQLDKNGFLEALIWYDQSTREYCILDSRKPTDYNGWPIKFCPWCGKKFPERIDPWDTIKKEYGEDYVKYSHEPSYKKLPPELMKEFETDEWWKKRNIGPDDPGF